MTAGIDPSAVAEAVPTGAEPGRIGPNAITRIAEALMAVEGASALSDIFRSAGLARHLEHPPETMVEERDVVALQAAVRLKLGEQRASTVSWIAGQRTADYLLARRIPRAVQRLLTSLPARVAARLLLAAIGRHAWTFAGSGQFGIEHGIPIRLTFSGCPVCRGARTRAPACAYYGGTFERLFRALVHPDTEVREIACEATGEPRCRFTIRWPGLGPISTGRE